MSGHLCTVISGHLCTIMSGHLCTVMSGHLCAVMSEDGRGREKHVAFNVGFSKLVAFDGNT
jgi:hypothetical protein